MTTTCRRETVASAWPQGQGWSTRARVQTGQTTKVTQETGVGDCEEHSIRTGGRGIILHLQEMGDVFIIILFRCTVTSHFM